MSDEVENPLTILKKELKEIHDQAFGFAWSEIEERIKQSYRNGITEGERRAKSGKPATGDGESSGKKRDWSRGKSAES